MYENSDEKEAGSFKVVIDILKDIEQQFLEKTGCPVLGIGITFEKNNYQMTVNSGVYIGVAPNNEYNDEIDDGE